MYLQITIPAHTEKNAVGVSAVKNQITNVVKERNAVPVKKIAVKLKTPVAKMESVPVIQKNVVLPMKSRERKNLVVNK